MLSGSAGGVAAVLATLLAVAACGGAHTRGGADGAAVPSTKNGTALGQEPPEVRAARDSCWRAYTPC